MTESYQADRLIWRFIARQQNAGIMLVSLNICGGFLAQDPTLGNAMHNLRSLLTAFLAIISIDAMTAEAHADAEIRTEKITDNIYMVVGTAGVDVLQSGDLDDFSSFGFLL